MTLTVIAQTDDSTLPVINADNIAQLQSVQQIDFDAASCEITSGWFQMNAIGTRYAVLDTRRHIHLWDATGDLLLAPSADDCDTLRDTADVTFGADDTLYTTLQSLEAVTVTATAPDADTLSSDALITLEDVSGSVINSWVADDTSMLWLEFVADETTLLPLTLDDAVTVGDSLAYAPASDENAVVRIGRIPPPYVVTSSLTGEVKLWDMSSGEVLHTVDNGTGEPSVFGNINRDATHLVWRDNANETLYLLDFVTGENRAIDSLDGEYAQWYFLTNDASAIIAVNIGFEPVVVAWDVETGERTVLGEYRACERPQPDMARLSADGTTLVIGCDSGLDIWRIPPQTEEADNDNDDT